MSLQIARVLSLALVFAVVSTAADARSRNRKKQSRGDSVAVQLLKKQFIEIEALRKELGDIRKLLRPQVASIMPEEALIPEPPRNPVAVAPMPIPDITSHTLSGYEQHIAKSAKVKDLTPKLADKITSILAACEGSRITSAYRRGARVRGSGRPSLHSKYPSRAADLAGNPVCIRKQLVGWEGGLSTDYARVRHYHVSYDPNGREWGARFAHYSKRRPGKYARHHRRYAAIH